MQNEKKPFQRSGQERKPYITIDDLVIKAEDLFVELKKLSEIRHPLDIRKIVRKGVGNMADQNEQSRTLKAGSKTYFFDIKKTKDEKPYLVITESRFKGEGEERERSTIVVFQDIAEEFERTVSEMITKIL
ncbi:DUF3276 family protein [Chloroflexota bacterium]